MQQTLKRTSLTLLISGALSVGVINNSLAAEVPAGVQLAQQQNIVINNGSEVASLIRIRSRGYRKAISFLTCWKGW